LLVLDMQPEINQSCQSLQWLQGRTLIVRVPHYNASKLKVGELLQPQQRFYWEPKAADPLCGTNTEVLQIRQQGQRYCEPLCGIMQHTALEPQLLEGYPWPHYTLKPTAWLQLHCKVAEVQFAKLQIGRQLQEAE
jgi:hypothetical protein